MNRIQVSGNTPADLAEKISDVGEEYTKEDLRDARLEIEDAILEGGWREHKLWHVLQDYLNVEPALYDKRLEEIAMHLNHLLNGAEADRGEVTLAVGQIFARAEARYWLNSLIEPYVKDDWVEERAAEIAGERLELAS